MPRWADGAALDRNHVAEITPREPEGAKARHALGLLRCQGAMKARRARRSPYQYSATIRARAAAININMGGPPLSRDNRPKGHSRRGGAPRRVSAPTRRLKRRAGTGHKRTRQDAP
jgi:hypothetical protein